MTSLDARQPPSPPTDAVVLELASRRFGLDHVSIERRLPGERDFNVQLVDGTGVRWIMKFATTDPHDVLDAQTQALRWIERVMPRLPVPRVRRSVDDADITTHGDAIVRVLSYLDGVVLADANRHAPAVLESVGRLVGEVDRALDGFEHASLRHESGREFRWNPMHAASFAREHLDFIVATDQRGKLRDMVDEAATRVGAIHETLRTSIVHGDANDYNVLLSGSGPEAHASGLIDFGDLMETWTVGGSAIACAYAMLGAQDPLANAIALLRGVHASFAIPAHEFDAIMPLVVLRFAVTVTNAARARSEEPDNTYLQITESGAWSVLDALTTLAHDDVADRLRDACITKPTLSAQRIRDARSEHLGPSLSLSYREPLMITRGDGVHLFDESGHAYLDCVNNVNCVGHCHPRVVEAGNRQAAILNTNTRYLHPNIVTYAERLVATLPDPLRVCFIVNSGTEANELALRLARTFTNRQGVVALKAGYHGNTQSLVDVSSYKCERHGGSGPPDHVKFARCPDPYRTGADVPALADDVGEAIDALDRAGHPVAAFLAESLPGCGGQIVPPDGYFAAVYQRVRAAGGVCIADEVQTGLARVGSHFWAFQTQDVVPDIVTMGKPLGNGHPLAAVVTTPAIAEAFDNGMEFFNTFGGNPVSCAIGSAVLDVIEAEQLQTHALAMGRYWIERLRDLQSRHALIGDVRGRGLFIGAELVRDRATREPATAEATEIANRMRARRILISIDGPFDNVIKLKPPLVIRRSHIDRMCDHFDIVLSEIASA